VLNIKVYRTCSMYVYPKSEKLKKELLVSLKMIDCFGQWFLDLFFILCYLLNFFLFIWFLPLFCVAGHLALLIKFQLLIKNMIFASFKSISYRIWDTCFFYSFFPRLKLLPTLSTLVSLHQNNFQRILPRYALCAFIYELIIFTLKTGKRNILN
jgi:hypothetical protein